MPMQLGSDSSEAAVSVDFDAGHEWAAELIEAAAYAALYEAAPRDLADGKSAHIRRFGQLVAKVLEPLSEVPMFNGVVGVGVADDDAELVAFDEATAWMRSFGIGGYAGVVPGSRAERLLREERGLEPGYAWMKFAFDLSQRTPDPPHGLGLERVGPERADVFGATVAEGYDLPESMARLAASIVGKPGWECFVASVGDQAAAAAALYVAGNVAWLGMAATRHAFRRRGAQAALLACRLRRAREHGCGIAFTETGEQTPDRPSGSYRNILRTGFKEMYLRPNLIIPPAGAERE